MNNKNTMQRHRPFGVKAYSTLLICASIALIAYYIYAAAASTSLLNNAWAVIAAFFLSMTGRLLWKLNEKGRDCIIALSSISSGVGIMILVMHIISHLNNDLLIVSTTFLFPSVGTLIYFTRPKMRRLFTGSKPKDATAD